MAMTIEEMRKQSNRNKTKKTKQRKNQTESNSKPKSRKGSKEDQAKPKKNTTIAQLKEYMYKGSGKDKAVLELLKKLEKDGGSSLDSSGFGRRIKV